jgi:hypothetical protein
MLSSFPKLIMFRIFFALSVFQRFVPILQSNLNLCATDQKKNLNLCALEPFTGVYYSVT